MGGRRVLHSEKLFFGEESRSDPALFAASLLLANVAIPPVIRVMLGAIQNAFQTKKQQKKDTASRFVEQN
jgi:hypothetical protein